MLITTRKGLKGELYLSAIGHTLKAGSSVTISDEYSRDPDILWAVSKGMIEVEVDDKKVVFDDENCITLKNTGHSLLNLPFINKTISTGHEFTLSKEDFDSSEISFLIKRGDIEVVVSKSTKDSVKKVTKKATKKAVKRTTNKATKKTSNKKSKAVSQESSIEDHVVADPNKEKTSINENNSSGMEPVTIAQPETDEEGIIFVDNNNEVK